MDKLVKILIVEDLPSDAQLAEREIKRSFESAEIKVVETKAEFIREFEEFAPDIVVSDFQLPSFDGLSALKIVLDLSPTTPVIILTGSMNEDTAVDCMKAGAMDYVIKEHIKRLGPAIINALKQKELNIEKLQAQHNLKLSEEKFRNIFQNHSAAKFIIDPSDGKIIEANVSASKFYGWPVDVLEGMYIYQINTMHPDQIKLEMARALALNNTHFDFIHKKADGTLVNVEVFSSRVFIGHKEYLHTIVHDVTEKKKTEQQLKLLSRSVEQSPVSILITSQIGKIEYVNPIFTAVSGYTFEEVLGKTPRILKSGVQENSFYENMWKTILSGKDWSGELVNKRKSGELYWEKAEISPILNEKGEITHFVAVKEDITEKKRMIQDLIIAKEKAEESDNLKTAFLQNMSHEIRTPMNGILGFLDLLKDKKISEETRERYIEIVNMSAQRLLSSINNILEISKIQSGQNQPVFSQVNVEEILKYYYIFFKQKADENSTTLLCNQGVSGVNAILKTDKYKFESIISNLINNALKFSQNRSVEFGDYLENNSYIFYVKDTGIGIPSDRIGAIFDRFVQADLKITRPHEGVGLGLSIVKAYVESLGGEINVESEVGAGSTFIVTLPIL
jgi:PAS domain S-box-containing protein